MNAYLFTAITTTSQLLPNTGRYGASETVQTWDGCQSLIVLEDQFDVAQRKYEDWLHFQPPGENPRQVRVRKIAAAQFVSEELAESGSRPLDWNSAWKKWEALAEATPADDFEQGYWVDVESVIRPGMLADNIEMLLGNLQEDLRTGLNWSPDRQFFFIVSIIAPLVFSSAATANPAGLDGSSGEDSEPSDLIELGELYNLYPGALDKEAAALVEARNSVVAAWLWRKYAASTRLATHQIRIEPWCGVMGLKEESDSTRES